MDDISIKIINPKEVVFEGHVSSLVAPGSEGLFGILPGHAPMMALLKGGYLKIEGHGQTKSIFIENGFLEVEKNKVTVLFT